MRLKSISYGVSGKLIGHGLRRSAGDNTTERPEGLGDTVI
jgi:hypothetical protein